MALRVLAPNGLEFEDGSTQDVADAPALMLGIAGTIPVAPTNEVADFLVVVPYNMTLSKLKVTAKTGPSTNTTVQMRRSTDGAASFSNALGAVTLLAGERVASADPADLDVNEGDVIQASITAGGGSGANLMLQVIGRRR